MKATRRRFSREFKLEAVRQLAAGRRLADVARALGVDGPGAAALADPGGGRSGDRVPGQWAGRRPRRPSCSGCGGRWPSSGRSGIS